MLKLLNREIGWLKFNRRVLALAQDPRTPLLERLRFLSIFRSNLDEFFMKRVGGLQRQWYAGVQTVAAEGLSVEDQLTKIRIKVLKYNQKIKHLLDKEIFLELKKENIELLKWADLQPAEKKWATDFFNQKVFPVLTPMAVDVGHPFPLISNLSLSLAVSLRLPNEEDLLFARIKIPQVFPNWLEASPQRFVSLVDVIRHHIDLLFPKMEIKNVMAFRVTRNIDIEAADEEGVEDLLEMIEEEVKQRKFAEVVRIEHGPDPDPWLLQFIVQELDLGANDIYEYTQALEYFDLSALTSLPRPHLKYKPWSGVTLPPLADESVNIFNLIRTQDMLVHHPYESFKTSVERFVLTAADDPDVVALKMTLYRTGEKSSIVHALIRAAEKGKQVVCLIELKARLDEERNIFWAQEMEKAGVHVVYGIIGHKTHAKLTLVVRREKEEFRSYAHIGTGNYHPATSKLYTDLSFFSARPEIVSEVVEVFHYLTGRSLKSDYKKLLVAPINLKNSFLNLISEESENARQNKPARIIAKFNNLEDKHIIDALYKASTAGVQIDLIVRGFCCLIPQASFSKNIRVYSVLGQFLEHSRVYYFSRGQADPIDGQFYISSADWMHRNLMGRVEVAAPIEDRALREKLFEFLNLILNDHRLCWEMDSKGAYKLRKPRKSQENSSCQDLLMERTKAKSLVLLPRI